MSNKTGYHVWPLWYDIRGFFILKLSYRSSLWRQVLFFSKHIRPQHLEVAVGTGSLFSMILFYSWLRGLRWNQIHCIDLHPTMLSGAKLRLFWAPRVKWMVANVEQLPFAENSFDSIAVANSFHSFADPERSLLEMRRVLKPESHLALNVIVHPEGSSLRQRWASRIIVWGQSRGLLKRSYSPQELREMFRQAGFKIQHEASDGNSMEFLLQK